MGHTKIRRRKKRASMYWLPLLVVGGLVLAGLVALFGQPTPGASASSSSPRFDPDVKPTTTGAPRVMVPQESLDYGDVKLGSTVEAVFEVRNTGDEPLIILGDPQVEVVQGCCPSRAVLSALTIKPGYQATVTYRSMMHGNMGGPHEFRLHLHTNDPEEPEKVLTVRANWVS